MGYKDVKEIHIRDLDNDAVERFKKALQKIYNKPMKLVGIKLLFLTEDDVLASEGMYAKGFSEDDYEG